MKSMTLNDSGLIVERWQYFLIGEGFPITVTGRFDIETTKATMGFQNNHSLQMDGIAGNQTMQKAMENGFLLVEPANTTSYKDISWPPKPPFKPLTPFLVRQAFGKNTQTIKGQPTDLVVQKQWEEEFIEDLRIPALERMVKYKMQPVRVHKRIAQRVLNLFAEWEKNGLMEKIVSVENFFDVRFVPGSRDIMSNHAYGIAFDLNREFNKTGHIPPVVGELGSVRELVPIANKHGFYWGGHLNRLEGSHFEFSRVGLL
jgi:hypothetical protein